MNMDIRPIRSDDDYDWTLAEIAPYFDNIPEKSTEDADRFDVLAGLISAYEATNHPIEAPSTVDMITTYMEETGLKQSDFAIVVGSTSRASEFLNRKRPLSISAIQKIHKAWRLPAEVLIQPYHLEQGPDATRFNLIGLHPRPPVPGNDTVLRNQQIKETAKLTGMANWPTVCLGYFNDVAWS